MKIIKSQLFIYFSPSTKVRKNLFVYEDILGKDFVTPFPVMRNIEDLTNIEIPRFETTSLNGFSTIKISPSFLLFETDFSEDYQKDPDKIKTYFERKFPLLWQVVRDEDLKYVGTILVLSSDPKPAGEVIPTMRGAFREDKMNDEAIVDLSFSYAKLIDRRYYVNVNIGGFMAAQVLKEENTGGKSVSESLETYHGIRVTIDVNTKPVVWTSNTDAEKEILPLFNKTVENASINDTSDFISGNPDFNSLC